MSEGFDIGATAHLPSPDLALAIRDAVRGWYAAYNKGAEDFNHTLLSAARFCADAITETPHAQSQQRALAMLIFFCAMNCDLQNAIKRPVNHEEAAAEPAFH